MIVFPELQESDTMTPIELRNRGYQALVDALGTIDTIIFLQQSGWGIGNYTEE